MSKHYITCDICEAHCGLEVTLEDGEIKSIRGDKEDHLSNGHICPKAYALQDVHDDPDRLRTPMRRVGKSWEECSWAEAFSDIAERLQSIRAEHGRHSIGTYTGNPTAHNYGALLGGLVLAEVLRTHQRYSATSADQLPHMLAALEMFGHQLLLPVPDIDRTDLMVILGANPAASNGSLMTAPDAIGRIKAIRKRGGHVVLFDPRRTETAKHVDVHHFVRPGSDGLLLFAILCTLFEEDLISKGEWREYAAGLDTIETLAKRFPPERVAETVGVDAVAIRELARKLAASNSACVYGRMGVCTQRFGGLNAWLVNVLNVVTGNLDRVGGVMFTTPAFDLVSLASKLGQRGHFGVRKSRVSGLPEFGGEYPVSVLAEEIETEGENQIKALVTLAGNPVLSAPNGPRLSKAFESLDFMVSIDWYCNATTRHAHYILPPVSALERDNYGVAFHALAVRNTARYSPALFEAPAGALGDWDILLKLSQALLAKQGATKNLGAKLSLKAAKTLGPRGVLKWALRMGTRGPGLNPFGKGVTLGTLVKEPSGVDFGPLEPCLPKRLETDDKMIRLAPELFVKDVERLDADLESGALMPNGKLLLIGRRHLRSNNTWLHNSERLVKGKNRCTLLIHPVDAKSRKVSDGDTVSVTSRVGSVEIVAHVDDGIAEGVVSIPHGWGNGKEGIRLTVANSKPGVSANDLTDDMFFDELTGTAGFNGVPVEVTAS